MKRQIITIVLVVLCLVAGTVYAKNRAELIEDYNEIQGIHQEMVEIQDTQPETIQGIVYQLIRLRQLMDRLVEILESL